MGLYVEFDITDQDSSKWQLNQLNAMFGNWWFAMLVYGCALCFPGVKFFTLAAVLFGLLEGVMHLFLFDLRLHRWYNPGLFSALFLLTPVSLTYLLPMVQTGIYRAYDWILAICWIVLHYWIAFRSPLYKWMGRKSDRYGFSREEVEKSLSYLP